MPDKHRKPASSPSGGTSMQVFIRKHAQIIYAIILVLLIPMIIIANSLFVINKFKKNLNVQLQRQALMIGELIDVTLITSKSDLDRAVFTLDKIYEGPEEIRSIEILVPRGDDFEIIASPIASSIGKPVSGDNNTIAWYNDRAIAHLSIPSSDDAVAIPELRDQRFWNIVMPLHDEQGGKIALLNLKMSLGIVDDLERSTLIGSYALLFGTLIIIILLMLVNSRFFQYAILYRKLQEVDEMKDEFISMASHELRTPITAIKGYISMFVDGSFGALSEAGDKGVKIINASIARLGDLVEDLLNVSRIEQGRLQFEMTAVNIDEVITQTIDELKFTAEEKHLELHYESGKWSTAHADKDRLHQVLVNILGNSIKYTKEGSVTITVADLDDELKIKVKDTGIGMSAKDREQLFDKFYRVKSEQTKGIVGTGLGLWITKQIVENMGGEITVDSIENVGTEMSFTLQKDKKEIKKEV